MVLPLEIVSRIARHYCVYVESGSGLQTNGTVGVAASVATAEGVTNYKQLQKNSAVEGALGYSDARLPSSTLLILNTVTPIFCKSIVLLISFF